MIFEENFLFKINSLNYRSDYLFFTLYRTDTLFVSPRKLNVPASEYLQLPFDFDMIVDMQLREG